MIFNEAFDELLEDQMLFQFLVLIDKRKGDLLNKNFYRDVKLLDHSFKLQDSIRLNKKLKEIVYGLTPGRRNS